MEEETRRIFEAIVEQADRIRKNQFEHHVRKVGFKYSGKLRDDGMWEWEFGFPDDKERDAFLLTFRMFYQNDDEVGILQQKRFLNAPDVSTEWKAGFKELRKIYLTFLHDYPSSFESSYWGELPTNEELLKAVLYGGGLVHVSKNRASRERFLSWAKDDFRKFHLMVEFTGILLCILSVIYRLAALCQAELDID